MKDQYKYFRIEARELLEGLSRATLQLERGEQCAESLAELLRLAHTLKGAARVVKQSEIADCTHALEEVFAPYRESERAIPAERIDRALQLLDKVAVQLSLLDLARADAAKGDGAKGEVAKSGAAGETKRMAGEDAAYETVRVEVEEMDRLLDGVTEAAVQIRGLRAELETLEEARRTANRLSEHMQPGADGPAKNGYERGRNGAELRGEAGELETRLARLRRNLGSGIDQVEAEFTQVWDAANRLRLASAATVFPALERAVRDASQSLGKQARFAPSGGASRLDAHVLAALRDALLHLVRNAVAHGIEMPAERVARKKEVCGVVSLRIEQRGTRMLFVCEDDGRGVDLEALRRVAVERGILAAGKTEGFGMKEAAKLMMQGGVSTAGTADEISGRGIGLDVVREVVARLKGTVELQSEPGLGTKVAIGVPVSLSSLAALEVTASGVTAAIPLDATAKTMRVADGEIARAAGRESLVCNGQAIPFLSLSRILGKPESERAKRGFRPVVVVVSPQGGRAALGVDRLVGISTVVVRPLANRVVAEKSVAGTSLGTEGDVRLVLDADGLVAEANAGGAAAVAESATKLDPVLVIDDSLTTRMLEQSILESAGYEVELATSAEEGLEKARAKKYGLFLVDVEMPGMSGFEFVARTRADARLSQVPAILVTSRNAAEDRKRGEEAGAKAYIVKGEFDQGYLLRMTRELMGG
jgi:two-component system chemotaxis sensor kinase CheA